MTHALFFRGEAANAARHIIANTSLGGLPDYALTAVTTATGFDVEFNADWRFSGGEVTTLLPLLGALAYAKYPGVVAPFNFTRLSELDPETRQVCVETIRMALP